MTVELVAVRAVADRPAGQGHAHRPGHHPRLVVRPRRPAAGRHRAPGRRSRCATRSRDLEAAGIADHPGRRARPARAAAAARRRPAGYLDWAVGAFRLATGGVADSTQIHTHLCYSEFGEVIDAIDALDADVTTIEAARSQMEVLDELGPGVRAWRRARASTTSTRRGCPRRAEIAGPDHGGAARRSGPTGCGSTRTAG